MRRPHRLPLLTLALAALAAVVVPSTAAQAAPLPVVPNHLLALGASLLTPEATPPGANPKTCRPSAARPRPVVLVHGTWENMRQNWSALAPTLANEGYCVYAYNYGGSGPLKGNTAIEANAARLGEEIDEVLAATGASQVDVVGHSAGGGVTPRYYLKNLGGATKVHTLVGLAASNHGTTLSGLVGALKAVPFAVPAVNQASPGAVQQFPGSAFNAALDAGGDTVPGVAYRNLVTVHDEVITPYTNSFLSGPDVENVTIQDLCPKDASEHLALPYDRNALRVVLNWLDPTRAQPVTCVSTLPLIGG